MVIIDDDDLNSTRHCRLYTRHPLVTALVSPTPEFTPGSEFEPDDRMADAAASFMINASSQRHDQHRSGYMTVEQLADWFVADTIAAIDSEFPRSEVRLVARGSSCEGSMHILRLCSSQ
jgi:hypothetical protein